MKAYRRREHLISDFLLSRLSYGAALLMVLLHPVAASAQSFSVTSESLKVTVTCSPMEIQLTKISGSAKISGLKGTSAFEYLNGSTPLLSFGLNNSDPSNYYNGTFNNVSCSMSGETLSISANSSDGSLAFWFTLSPDGSKPVVIVSAEVQYQSPTSSPDTATAFFRAQFPNLQFNVPNSSTLPGNAMAMVPQMIGSVVPLGNVDSYGLGASYATDGTAVPPSVFGLPTNLNVMEIAEVYDGGGGGGLYFLDLDGDYSRNIASIQFNLTGTTTTSGTVYQIVGYWTALLKINQAGFNQWVTLPRLAIGTHSSGDWHYAVDYYVGQRSPNWTFSDTPSWLRNAAGIYLLGVAGGGSFFNTFPFTAINDEYFGIQSFGCNTTTANGLVIGSPPNMPGHRCLGDALLDAQALGSNVIYLTSWWSGTYDNKGDYIVDPKLGGQTSLAQGVAQVHNAGGYVILYMEPYVAADSTMLVSSGPGNGWRAQPRPPIPADNSSGKPIGPADICAGKVDCMAIPNTQWQDYLINTVSISNPAETSAVNLINITDVDGIFLDSWGWQMNWPVGTTSEDADYTSKEWSAAAVRFVDRFRAAMQTGKSTKIVMGENNTGQFPFHWDGGSAADLSSWASAATEDAGILWGSPIRYAMPNANFFVNGPNLNGLNQVFAAGHNLALGSFWLLDVTQTQMRTKTQPQTPQNQPFAPYGIYDITTTLSTTTGSKLATATGIAKGDAGFTIAATSVQTGTTIESVKNTSTGSITLSQNATATGSVSATLSWPVPARNTIVSNYVAYLLGVRQTYADALISGKQLPMPATSSPNVVAYMYQGQKNQILTIVNNGSAAIPSVTVSLDPNYGTGAWNVILPSTPSSPVTISENSAGEVTLTDLLPVPSSLPTAAPGTVPQMGLVVLQRACPTLSVPYACTAPKSYPVTTKVPLMDETFSFSAAGPPAAGNWTDWIVSGTGTAPSGRWSTVYQSYFSGGKHITANFLDVQSPSESSLLFYDNFDAGLYFTYSGQVTFDSFGSSGFGEAGLSFRLSDNQVTLDAGNQGYDVVLSNEAFFFRKIPLSSGSVIFYKRQPPTGGGSPPMRTLLQSAPFSVSTGQTYQLSVTANTSWTSTTPSYPSSTTFTVSVNGIEQFQVSDGSYLSGRFGVNSSNASARFGCLQANGQRRTDGAMPASCPIPPPPPPTVKSIVHNCSGPLANGYRTCM